MAGEKFFAGDTGAELEVVVKDLQTKAVKDLTGFTVKLYFKIDSGSRQGPFTMTVASPLTGKATRTFLTGELVAGWMEAEVEVVRDSDSKLVGSTKYFFEVESRLPS